MDSLSLTLPSRLKPRRARPMAVTPATARVLPRWLLVAAVGLGGPLAAGAQTVPNGVLATRATLPETLTISGVVLDDSLNVPVAGVALYVADTKYGTVANGQGVFTLTFPTGWKPVRGGFLELRVYADVFLFKYKVVRLDWRSSAATQPLAVRLASAPGRGRAKGVSIMMRAQPVPPPTYPARSRTNRP